MDEPVSSCPWPVVSDAAVAGVLLDARRRRFLAPFFGQPRSVGAAAAELGVRPNSLLYQVGRLQALGLLVVASVEPRAGRAIRRYRAASERFFVPFAATDATTLEALLLDMIQTQQQRFARNFARALLDTPEGGMGYLVGRHDHGEVEAYFSPDGVRAWTVLELDHADAKALQREQWALWARHLGKRGSGRSLAHFDLTPLLGER